jgi:hypothetical protein
MIERAPCRQHGRTDGPWEKMGSTLSSSRVHARFPEKVFPGRIRLPSVHPSKAPYGLTRTRTNAPRGGGGESRRHRPREPDWFQRREFPGKGRPWPGTMGRPSLLELRSAFRPSAFTPDGSPMISTIQPATRTTPAAL